jgi:predicted CopG family antitoxin
LGSKNISISDEAYARLAALKGPNESFTDVVNRLTGKNSLMALAGVLTEEDAEVLRGAVAELRAASVTRVISMSKRVGKHAR